MKLEQSFEVHAPAERVWDALIDVERAAPCLPGATVTARNDDGSFNGEFRVKIGPSSAAYHGRLTLENVDATARATTIQASGTDRRGQGAASATIVSTVAAAAAGAATVTVTSDYTITGRLARFGRGGQIEEIAAELLREFAANLEKLLAEPAPAAQPDLPAVPEATVEPPSVAPEPEPAPAADPDAVIEGALPVADALADEPPTPDPEPEPVRQPQPAPAPAPQATFPGYPPPADEPSTTVTGPVARVKGKALPLGALVFGFLVALRVLRRRG